MAVAASALAGDDNQLLVWDVDAEQYIDMAAPDCDIQAAIQKVERQDGAVVQLPEGRFLPDRNLRMLTGVTLLGRPGRSADDPPRLSI